MKEKKNLFSATGIPSLFLIFGVLMLVILSLLGYGTSRQDLRASTLSLEQTTAYYNTCSEAADFYARLVQAFRPSGCAFTGHTIGAAAKLHIGNSKAYQPRTDIAVKRIARNAKLIPENRRKKLFPPSGTRRVYSRNVMRLAREATSVPAPPTLTPTRRARASCVKRLSRMAAGTLLMIWQVSAEISIVPWDKRRANSMWTASIRARLPEKVKNAAKVASSPQSTVFSACRSKNQSASTMTVRPRT